MSEGLHHFLSLDMPAMLAGTLAVLMCALLGNFLVLRRQSLMGDAISHAVLPGLVAGFIITGSRSTLPMFLGAAGAGIVTVILVEVVRRLGRLESGAAMGVVFSVLFALGVVLIERGAARGVDLDPDCVLNGQLERIFWFPPTTWGEMLTWHSLKELPRELVTLAAMALISAIFIVVFFKELRIAAFDPGLAASLGFSPTVMHFALMLLVAAAVVASFEAVGSILVVSMLICPAATARLLTDRLATQIWLSAILGVLVGIGGYACAVNVPALWGSGQALGAAGMMTTVAGILLAGAIFAAPRHGIVARLLRRRSLSIAVAREDLLADLYRMEEAATAPAWRPTDGRLERLALSRALSRDEVRRDGERVVLTPKGRAAAEALVRAHRLWETYLVRHADLRADHVHPTAMDLEHVTDAGMVSRLAAETDGRLDPHGRPIPAPPDAPDRR